MGGAASAGLLLGGAGMWLKGTMASSQPSSQPQINAQIDDPESRWCHTYLRFILRSNTLQSLEQEIKRLVGILDSCDKLFPTYGDDATKLFHDWVLLDETNTLEERKSYGRSMKDLLIEPDGVDLILAISLKGLPQLPGLRFDALEGDEDSPEYTYVSKLVETVPKESNVNDSLRLGRLRKELKKTAKTLEDEWDMLQNNEWMGGTK
jgi:hypothetical protein